MERDGDFVLAGPGGGAIISAEFGYPAGCALLRRMQVPHKPAVPAECDQPPQGEDPGIEAGKTVQAIMQANRTIANGSADDIDPDAPISVRQ